MAAGEQELKAMHSANKRRSPDQRDIATHHHPDEAHFAFRSKGKEYSVHLTKAHGLFHPQYVEMHVDRHGRLVKKTAKDQMMHKTW